MSTEIPSGTAALDAVLAEVARLRRFTGPPAEFWPALIAVLSQLGGAAKGLLVLRGPQETDPLRKLGEWAQTGHADRLTMAFNRALPDLVARSIQGGSAVATLEAPEDNEGSGSGTGAYAVGVNLPIQGGQDRCVAVLLLTQIAEAGAREVLVRLALAADVPGDYQTAQAALQARRDAEKLGSVMDVLVLVNAETRFLATTLAFCNALASRFECERVSLGWLAQGFVRLKSISRTEKFDKKMAAVQAIEKVMEECLDQDDEVIVPPPEGATVVTRDHERFAREEASGHVVSLPIRVGDKPVAVITCERVAKAFSALEVQQLRLACDQVARRLSDLQRLDRWFGARWAAWLKEKLAKVLGPEHTWAKVGAVAGALVIIGLLLPMWPYRVEGNFIVRSEEVSYLTSPFDGYIKSVEARPGDVLPAGGVLLTLNTEQLELDEATAIADQTRYLREAEKARASRNLAEMRIAQALADQAKARLDLVRYRLGQSRIKTPFAGVVIEGDLRQRIGAPVKQGDALFKVARTDELYIEAEIRERDVHEVLNRASGEVAFVSQPKLKFPVKVVRLEPAAMSKDKENVFIMRWAFVGKPESWWRPGMSGICKVDVERRTLLWVLTHRTVDFLRLLLWW